MADPITWASVVNSAIGPAAGGAMAILASVVAHNGMSRREREARAKEVEDRRNHALADAQLKTLFDAQDALTDLSDAILAMADKSMEFAHKELSGFDLSQLLPLTIGITEAASKITSSIGHASKISSRIHDDFARELIAEACEAARTAHMVIVNTFIKPREGEAPTNVWRTPIEVDAFQSKSNDAIQRVGELTRAPLSYSAPSAGSARPALAPARWSGT